MFLTLITALGGGLMRMLPELISLWQKKTDNQHELSMLGAQVELEKLKGANRRDEINLTSAANLSATELKGGIDSMLASLDLQKEALRGQMQRTGIRIVDMLNFLVRPVVTYYFLLMHGLAKIAMFAIAVHSNMNQWDAILKIWSVEDAAILSGIISFWFVGRVFDKKK